MGCIRTYVPSVACLQDPPLPQPPPADGAPDQSDGGTAAAFEVERPSLQELLERPIQGKGKVIISSEQLKQLAVVLNNPVQCTHTEGGPVLPSTYVQYVVLPTPHCVCVCRRCCLTFWRSCTSCRYVCASLWSVSPDCFLVSDGFSMFFAPDVHKLSLMVSPCSLLLMLIGL